MRRKLLDILVCPSCRSSFSVKILKQEGEEIVEGLLSCKCADAYPIINTIPRILREGINNLEEFKKKYKERLEKEGVRLVSSPKASGSSDTRTQRSFGYQWTTFKEMDKTFREHTLSYLYPLTPEFFKGKLGLDAGCGIGRHMYYLAEFGAEMVGIDFSAAIDSAHLNLKGLPNVHLVQTDIYRLPFKEGVFDFVYSIGVLHHLPDPKKGFTALLPVVKDKGSVSIWVYSKARFILNSLLEMVRWVTTRLPLRTTKWLSLLMASIDWCLFIAPYRYGKKIPLLSWMAECIARLSPRTKEYSECPFFVCYTDWFDRLSAPIRFYYGEEELRDWAVSTGLRNVHISPTGKNGWRLHGEKG